MFNPTMLSLARTVKWQTEQGNRGENSSLPKVNFSGVEPYKLTISQVVFDTYETRASVMDYIKKLKKGVESPNGQNKRPPVYYLKWGGKKSFLCVMTSLSYKLDMFLPDGTPVRALVDIALQEVEKENLPGDKKSQSKDKNRKIDNRARRGQGNQGQPKPYRPASEESDF
ncbi:hypothetical protein IFO70_21165 [Phormidium tenue FACHB-886]|nr:hypothetical protein [Phormidium tenue FACHB-886]